MNKMKTTHGTKNNYYHPEPEPCHKQVPTKREHGQPLYDYFLLAHKVYVDKVHKKGYDYTFTLQYNDKLVLEAERHKSPVNSHGYVSSLYRFIANWDKQGIFSQGADDVLLSFLYKDEHGNSERYVSKIEIVHATLGKLDCQQIIFDVKQGCGADVLADLIVKNEPRKLKDVTIIIAIDRTKKD